MSVKTTYIEEFELTLNEFEQLQQVIDREIPPSIKVFITEAELKKMKSALGKSFPTKGRRIGAKWRAYACECDVCNRPIVNGQEYYNVVTGHNGWANDSSDSRKHHHICSENCLAAYVKSYNETESEDSRYMEIDHETMCLSDLYDD